MTLNPPTQYRTDANLRVRQRLWELQDPPFDLVGWVLDLVDVAEATRALDVGCGNGSYLRRLGDHDIDAVGCDLSLGMLHATDSSAVVNADVCRLPFRSAIFDVVLAPHMLYHVTDRVGAASELARTLTPGGRCVVVTNGAGHLRSVRALVESAATPDGSWEMRNPSAHAFSLENGADQLRAAFASVQVLRPDGIAPMNVRDPGIIAEYVASTADHYEHEIDRPWSEVVAEVRRAVAATIASEGSFAVSGDVGAFVCRGAR